MIGAAMLAGCHSLPALHYYALDAVHPAGAARHAADDLLIHVRHVGVPHEIDHLGLTHHLGPTQLAVSDNDQWTAPLSVLIQGTITQDLGARLGYEHVVAADAPSVPARNSTQTALDLDFVSLSAGDTCGITAQVNWTLSAANGTSRHGTAQLSAPGATCPTALPAALSAALGDLADQLVRQITPS
ncbi:MAG: ABC-type transport auxiliary lipoprotein family protein [Steroidobacteraceae bacterium]